MKKVFIPQEPRTRDLITKDWRPLFDLSPALRYGELCVLLPAGAVLLDTATTIVGLKEKLKGITADDYMMMIGDPTAIAISVLVAGQITGGKLNLLKYDRAEKQYQVVAINTTERNQNGKEN